jgi:spermidine synthase
MHIYLGTFLIAFTTLALEVTLSRLLSVITWYHLAFFAISTAMLGMTAGATTVYLKPHWFTRDKLADSIAGACLGYALVVPAALIVLCTIALPVDLESSLMSLLAVIMATMACSLPFYFSGIAVTTVLTKSDLPIGKLYASDLIGASLGCLFVLAGLGVFDAPSLILLCGSLGALSSLIFARHSRSFRLRRLTLVTLVVLMLWAPFNSFVSRGIRPRVVKGKIQRTTRLYLEKWNSFSRVDVYKQSIGEPQYWGKSPRAPEDIEAIQHRMRIDGGAATVIRKFSSTEDIDHLRYDVTNIAYFLRPRGGACIIGVGGGRDIQSAILFGHERIVGLDVNPIFIDLLKNNFREFAGIADRKNVSLVVDEARSFLTRTKETYSIIQMSLIDTWAATGAGAFSLSENALYTVDAWEIFIDRLSEDGIFTVSRWYNPQNLGETGRVVSLAVASLLRRGVTHPADHIAMVTTGRISTLLLSKRPFSARDIAVLKRVSSDLEYGIAILPAAVPLDETLRDIVSAGSLEGLKAAIADKTLNYEPPTDENPYFFNMLRLDRLAPAFSAEPGVLRGNLVATRTLARLIVALLLITLATIVVPLVTRARAARPAGGSQVFWSGALYFSLIGAGFMFVEIALIQRLSVFLTHPVYALGVLLFTMIASTGVGSYLSEYLPLTRRPWVFLYPIAAAVAVLVTPVILPMWLSYLTTSGMLVKIVASIIVISPLGLILGLFFPTGMRLTSKVSAGETPWFWALNGIFGVSCSALAVFFSIYFGTSTNFYIAAVCYAAVLLSLVSIYRSLPTASSKPDATR